MICFDIIYGLIPSNSLAVISIVIFLQICEEFKSQPQHSMECSLLLIGDSDISVSHFGLQLLEYSIKYVITIFNCIQLTLITKYIYAVEKQLFETKY